MDRPTIAIIGAGFSGTMLCLHLLREATPATRILLIERTNTFGPGQAYGTDHASHLLNVPAGRMSAFPDQPLHFLTWLQRQPEVVLGGPIPTATSFVPRGLYGAYLRDMLAEATRSAQPDRLQSVSGKVVAITRNAGGVILHLDQDRNLAATVAVLATGNNPLTTVPVADPGFYDGPLYRHDPWSQSALRRIPANRSILLIGTGLTMVDTVLRLLDAGHTGPIHALSRRGRLPHTHAIGAVGVPMRDPATFPRDPSALLRSVRAEAARITAAGGTWHAAIDALRPITQALWRNWSIPERRRFLAHLRPIWDTHRHRMAPTVAQRIDAARASGQLRIHAGRIEGFLPAADGVDVTWQSYGVSVRTQVRVGLVVNCTGPASDITRSADPLHQSLLAGGLARPDALCLGFDVTETGALRGANGLVSASLFGVGPVCRSALWEITAVPDIRQNCQQLASHLAAMTRQAEADDPPIDYDVAPPAAMGKIPALWF
jgi:uncharacterized NAD(P)/FAD-binding protein YdhS